MNCFEKIYLALSRRDKCHFVPDKLHISILYHAYIGRKINWHHPGGFNEKLQWLKLHDHNPLYTKLVDKVEVKTWVAKRIGWEHIVPTLGVWDSFDQIDFNALPDRFVLKCTHDSGGLAICRDRATFDMDAAKEKIESSLLRNFYWSGREWPYKNVKPRIIAEEYLAAGTSGVTDYKLLCFGGRARCAFTCTGRDEADLRVDFFDLEWNHLPFTRHYPNADIPPAVPVRLNEMIALSERLAESIPFVRVDYYEIAGKLYFGEMTFYPGSGFEEFDPEEWDERLGSWLELPHAFDN